jgi:uncharacterized protein DUF4861
MTHKLAVVFIIFSLFGATAQREVSKEVRSRLFKQALADSGERDCFEKEEGGLRAAEENMSVEEVDVNRDRVPEYEVELSGPCTCGMVNCSVFLYRQSATGYELILDGAAGLGLELLKTSTNGYADLKVEARENAASTSSTIYKFDGKQYREARATITRTDTGETKTFTVSAGKKREYTKEDFRAYGRFVRERFDDFAWENDRVAHRTYGKALITWKGEPLTSSAIDIWSKRTDKLVINDWYMVDNYHTDQGEGVDAYSAGPTRGCGGNGIWSNGQLYIPTNFVDSRVLTNGPIRVMFELVYEPFDVNGTKVSQVLRVSLDAGSQLNRFTPYFQTTGGHDSLALAIGLKKVKDEQKQFNAEHGWLTIWEPMEKNLGMQGLAIVVDPRAVDKENEDKLNHLVVLKPGMAASYWAGFAWDRAGKITSAESWNSYVDQFAERLRTPIEIRVN